MRLKSVEVSLDEVPPDTGWYGLANQGLNTKEKQAYKQFNLDSVPKAPRDPTDKSWSSGGVAKPGL
jgi:hypothetical protein